MDRGRATAPRATADDTTNIPYPSIELLDNLPQIDFDAEDDPNWSHAVNSQVENTIATIEAVDSEVLDIIGGQMDALAQTFADAIQSTQTLFSALVRMKHAQIAVLQAKATQTAELLEKLETTMAWIRTL
jgi:hypothetical protein